MNKNKAMTVIGLLTVLMVFGFQNCSKVGVQDIPSVNGKVANNGSVSDLEMGDPPLEDGEEGDDDIAKLPSDREADLRALCLKEKTGAISGPEVFNLRGITVIESDDLTRVEDVRGILVIRGKTAGAKVKLLKNFRGAMVVCGMEVEDIDDTRGQMVLINSKAAHVNNVRGNINLIESELGSLTDFRGVIKQDGKRVN